jgi:phage tail sheath gpL-like
VTISLPAIGETSEAQLDEDTFHMLWLVHRNRMNSGRVQILLSAALQNGWRIVHASPEEQALLDAHGFGSRTIQ